MSKFVQGVVIRCSTDDGSVLMTLASIVSSGRCVDWVVLVDATRDGPSPRVVDLLNMLNRLGIRCVVDRCQLLPHNRMLAHCLRWAKNLEWDRVHHFDEDVVVFGAWWKQEWDPWKLESMSILESTDLKSREKACASGSDNVHPRIFAAGFTASVESISWGLIGDLDSAPLSVLEDSYLSSIFPGDVVLREEYGIAHCTRNTGGKYVEEISEKVSQGLLNGK